jgi:hypothetical protein
LSLREKPLRIHQRLYRTAPGSITDSGGRKLGKLLDGQQRDLVSKALDALGQLEQRAAADVKQVGQILAGKRREARTLGKADRRLKNTLLNEAVPFGVALAPPPTPNQGNGFAHRLSFPMSPNVSARDLSVRARAP